MPTYSGRILNKQLNCMTPKAMRQWIARNEGEWWRGKFSIIGGGKDRHTRRQRGYYWALLVPEICSELNDKGHTVTIHFMNFTIEVPYDKESTHKLLTGLCSRVGDDGDVMRISDDDMTVARMMVRIDNVLNFAVAELGMNEDRLKARRPE